jgi:pyruvate dehydrogenase E2 component (dihydrolipoamide acetyltransferase)
MTEVIMPKMGDGMEEGTLLEWLKKEGEKVKSGEAIAMIQTDKASLEMEAPTSGILAGILTQVGDSVPVGMPVAAILKEGEALPTDWTSGSVASSQNGVSESAVTSIHESPIANSPSISTEASSTVRIKASPLAKKIASESGIDLANIAGSGPGGRIVEADVRVSDNKGQESPIIIAHPVKKLEATADDQVIQLNKIRKITAKRTAESKQTVPHYYVTVEVDLEAISEVRTLFANDDEFKPSINDFLVKACALALRDMPIVNSTYQGDSILQFGRVSVGMAVALDDGLTLPVIHNADQMSLRQISFQSKGLASRARENRLTLEELSGSTFSISNMGMLNVTVFQAIINQPNAAILAVGSARKMVVPSDTNDDIEIRLKMNMTGSFDHRVIDGSVGAKFMNVVREYLEKPTRLLS